MGAASVVGIRREINIGNAFFECILKEGKIEEQLSGLKTPVVGNQTPQYTRFL
jgi:hypothetical protein